MNFPVFRSIATQTPNDFPFCLNTSIRAYVMVYPQIYSTDLSDLRLLPEWH